MGHGILVLVGAFLLLFLAGIGVFSGEPEAALILGIAGTSIGLLMVGLALPGILAGYGLLARKPWGRILAIVVSVLGIMNFPLGTIIGAYGLWVLFQEEATYYFQPG